GLLGDVQPGSARDGAHLVLIEPADGEKQMRQDVLAQAEKDIRLVLVGIGAAVDLALDHPHVMAGRDEVGVELFAVGPKLTELEPGVADNARIGRSALRVLLDEVIHDARKLAFKIESVERNVKPIGDPSSVAGVNSAATALLAVARRALTRRSSLDRSGGVAVGLLALDAGAHK